MDFVTLTELARITSPKLMATLLSEDPGDVGAQTKIGKLYRGLLSVDPEEQAVVRLVYGEEVTPKDSRYRMLKSRLKKMMLNSLMVEDALVMKFNSYDEAYLYGCQQLTIARSLIIRRAYNAAEDVALKTFQRLRKFEIAVINEGLTGVLSDLYLSVNRNPARFEEFQRLNDEYRAQLLDFGDVASKYRRIRNRFYNLEEDDLVIGELLLNFVREVGDKLERYPKSPSLQARIRSAHVHGLTLSGKYLEAIAAADEAENVLSNCYAVSNLVIANLALGRVSCSIHLRDAKLGRGLIERAEKVLGEGGINRLKLSEYATRLDLLTGAYDAALKKITKAKAETSRLLKYQRSEEVWFVLEAYVELLVLGGLAEERKPETAKVFRLGRFLNTVDGHKASKRSRNIQIIVVQAMFFLLRDEREAFIARTNALAKYCTRYLKDNDEIRHNCFFKLLIEVEKGGFDLKLRKRRIVTILERMTSPIAQEISRRTNAEIIPYEVLWNLIVDHLSCTDKRLRAPAAPGSV